MTLISGLQSGLQSGLLSGLNASGGSSYSIDTLTPAQVAEITGKPAPTYMWWHGAASGSNELVSSANLTDASTPTKEVFDETLNGTTTEFSPLSSDSIVASSSAIANIGAETVTIMHICRLVSYSVSTYTLLGKRDNSAPNNGYELMVTSAGQVQWLMDSTTGGINLTVAADHGTTNGQVILATRSIAGSASGLWTREGSSSGGIHNEALSSTKVLSVGANRTAAVAQRAALTMLWQGTDGDGFGESDRLAIAQALGLE